MKKRIVSLLMVLAMVFSIPTYALAAAPMIKKIEYEGGNLIEVEFVGTVQYKNPRVKLKGAGGRTISAEIVEKDRDELTFYAPGAKPGSRYTYTISGIRSGKTGKYSTISGSFRIPKWDPLIKDIDYDAREKELELDFIKRVQYKTAKAVVTDANGRTYHCRINEKKAREMEITVKGLRSGITYTVTVTGIRATGSSRYGSVSGEIKVR